MVALLLEANADPNVCDNSGYSPLYYAMMNDNYELMMVLLNHGVDFTKEGIPTLQGAILRNNNMMFDLRNKNGETSLQIAVKYNNIELVEKLLVHGGDPNIKDFKNGTCIGSTKNLKILALLFDHGGDPNIIIFQTATMMNIDIITLYLKYQANPNLQDDDGQTPLHRAVQHNDIAIVRLLLKAGADHTIRDKWNRTAKDVIENRALQALIQEYDDFFPIKGAIDDY